MSTLQYIYLIMTSNVYMVMTLLTTATLIYLSILLNTRLVSKWNMIYATGIVALWAIRRVRVARMKHRLNSQIRNYLRRR